MDFFFNVNSIILIIYKWAVFQSKTVIQWPGRVPTPSLGWAQDLKGMTPLMYAAGIGQATFCDGKWLQMVELFRRVNWFVGADVYGLIQQHTCG